MPSYLHLCSFDTWGAGIAARRLHEAMLAEEIDSRLVVRLQHTSAPGVSRLTESEHAFRRQKWFLALFDNLMFHTRYYVYSAFSTRNPRFIDEVCRLAADADVIVLHWVSYFLSVADIAEIAERVDADIVWYALDMSPFTGGCHYSWGCEEYRNGCETCPAVRFGLAASTIRSNMRLKLELFDSARLRVVAPNHWVASQAQGTGTANRIVPVAHIPIPTNVFSPTVARADTERFRIFYGYMDYASLRKGAHLFAEAMRVLAASLEADPSLEKPIVMLPGDGSDRALADSLPFDIDWVGRAGSDAELAGLYGRADCFVNTSLEDSGPMMISESLMTGCPVLSFDVGVARELIRDGYNGFVVAKADAAALADALLTLMREPTEARSAIARQARESVINKVGAPAAVRAFTQAVNADSAVVDQSCIDVD
jgi:glycosyltransferase involved in cell wall biosynthesis